VEPQRVVPEKREEMGGMGRESRGRGGGGEGRENGGKMGEEGKGWKRGMEWQEQGTAHMQNLCVPNYTLNFLTCWHSSNLTPVLK